MDRSQDPLTPAMAHEINNELAIIMSSCELLALSYDRDTLTLKRIDAIKTATQRIVSRLQKQTIARLR
jgi:hypothetical protein